MFTVIYTEEKKRKEWTAASVIIFAPDHTSQRRRWRSEGEDYMRSDGAKEVPFLFFMLCVTRIRRKACCQPVDSFPIYQTWGEKAVGRPPCIDLLRDLRFEEASTLFAINLIYVFLFSLPVPLAPEGLILLSYRFGCRILSRICFSLSRILVFAKDPDEDDDCWATLLLEPIMICIINRTLSRKMYATQITGSSWHSHIEDQDGAARRPDDEVGGRHRHL